MSEVLVIGDADLVEGFSLAGADIELCRDVEKVEWMVSELSRTRRYGIVFLPERLFEQLQEKTRDRAHLCARPLFLTIPAPATDEWWEDREDHISRIIRRAIGYRLKIRR